MSLQHALLTSLCEKNSTGFELARRFDKSIGYFWHATHQQIYRELARMEKAGWIDSRPTADAGQSRKREYSVLPEGKSELLRWASAPAALMDTRDVLMVKLRACANLPDIDLRSELQEHLKQHQKQWARYAAIEKSDFQSAAVGSRVKRLQYMLLKRGMGYEEANIAWIEEVLSLLETLKKEKGSHLSKQQKP
jgi:DNA-binding PadR family transcriptional regulator